MKTRFFILMLFVLGCIILAFPAPVAATRPETLTINADMWLIGDNSAAGSFATSGLFVDLGSASESFFITANTIHGVKTLVGAEGTITIDFQAQLTWTGPTSGVAQGQFVIISGTGAYKKLHGVGETYAELDLAIYHLVATYTGTGHFD